MGVHSLTCKGWMEDLKKTMPCSCNDLCACRILPTRDTEERGVQHLATSDTESIPIAKNSQHFL